MRSGAAQAQDFRIQYDSIVRLFLLPKNNTPHTLVRRPRACTGWGGCKVHAEPDSVFLSWVAHWLGGGAVRAEPYPVCLSCAVAQVAIALDPPICKGHMYIKPKP